MVRSIPQLNRFLQLPKRKYPLQVQSAQSQGNADQLQVGVKYSGDDALELLVLFPTGFAWEVQYDVSVR